MKNEKIIEVEKALTAEEPGEGDAALKYRNVRVDSIPVPDGKETDEESASEYPEELKEYLLEQGIWDREVDELLGNFSQEVSEDDLNIVAIFDSAVDLGQNYIDNVVGELDHHINAVLDYTALGEQIAESCDEYISLSSGRIVEFEL